MRLFARPRIVDVARTPLAARNGRAAVRVVAEGFGRLVVGDVARWVFGRFDDVVSVTPAPVVVVRLRGLFGADAREVRFTILPPIQSPPPPRARVAVPRPPLFAPRLPDVNVRDLRPTVSLPGD